jgi:hypothetical protein
MMTPEERAEKLLEGVYSIELRVTWHAIPAGPMVPAVAVHGYVEVLRDLIAAAIRAAVAEERDALLFERDCLRRNVELLERQRDEARAALADASAQEGKP